MVAWVAELLGSGCAGEGDLKDGEESFLVDSNQSLFTWLPDINNLPLGHVNDLVKAFHLATDHLSSPKGLVHEAISGFDGDRCLALTKEESESAGDVLSWVGRGVP